MDIRVFLFLFMVSSWCCNARNLTNSQQSDIVAVLQSNEELSAREAKHVEEVNKNQQLCTLCEEFATETLTYLLQNKTQTEIISILHNSCSQMHSFKQQCIILVDYHAPLFFLEGSSMQAEDFCRMFGLCEENVFLSQHLPMDKCGICHDVVEKALLKLKDPDTELEIVQLLLKACNTIGKNVPKCKRLVFEYTPIILINAQQFLETNDVCTMLHACNSAAGSLSKSY